MSVKLQTITELEDKCVDIRSNLLNFIYRIGMGHLGGELSIVEMTVALYYKYLNYDVMDPAQGGPRPLHPVQGPLLGNPVYDLLRSGRLYAGLHGRAL